MTITVVDGGDLAQVMADAGVEVVEAKAEKVADKPADKATEAKADDKAEAKPEAEPADDADDVEGEDGTTARQKRELSAKMLKAIGKKHRQVKEAEEFAADQIRIRREAEGRAAELDRQLKATQTKTEPKEEATEPQRENFASDAEFLKASVKWGVDQGIRQREAEKAEMDRRASLDAQYRRAAELVPDFVKVTSVSLNYPGAVVAYMQDSLMCAEFGYHFAKNPEALEKIAKLPPIKQVAEIGKIEATLRAFGSESKDSPKEGDKPNNGKAPAAAPSTVDTGFSPSKARGDAPVIKPLTSGEGSQVEADVREMTTRQMIEDFQKTNKVNLHSRKRH